MKKVTLEEFIEQGKELFGPDKKQWKFRCISCGCSQTYNDFIKAGVEEPDGYVHFSCIGRFDESKGCNWTLGGFFTIHEKEVVEGEKYTPVFNFEGEPYSEERENSFKKGKQFAFKKK